LLEIGEAVKALPQQLLSTQPGIPWTQIARMRDHLAHRYFDTDHAVLQATVDNDLPELERAVRADSCGATGRRGTYFHTVTLAAECCGPGAASSSRSFRFSIWAW
jgi:hypothetical protein